MIAETDLLGAALMGAVHKPVGRTGECQEKDNSDQLDGRSDGVETAGEATADHSQPSRCDVRGLEGTDTGLSRGLRLQLLVEGADPV